MYCWGGQPPTTTLWLIQLTDAFHLLWTGTSIVCYTFKKADWGKNIRVLLSVWDKIPKQRTMNGNALLVLTEFLCNCNFDLIYVEDIKWYWDKNMTKICINILEFWFDYIMVMCSPKPEEFWENCPNEAVNEDVCPHHLAGKLKGLKACVMEQEEAGPQQQKVEQAHKPCREETFCQSWGLQL